jgi:GNAT superfamily N-acetyltransferase
MMIVEPISYAQAYELVSNFHYLGKTRFVSQYRYGLFNEGELVGAVVYQPLAAPNSATSAFGLPRGNYKEFVEMSRLVLNPNLNGQNYGSMLIGKSLRFLKKEGIKAVLSYADSSRHLGMVYQASNFGYYGLTAQKCDYQMPDGSIKQRGKTKGMGGTWIPRTRKHRYIYVIDKNTKVVWAKESYPKGAQ